MARGWESKSVEDQISEAAARKQAASLPPLTAIERERNERRQSLLFSRSQILSRFNATKNDRYRAQLKAALSHIDEELKSLDS